MGGGLFQQGGSHRPSGCRSRERTAIIIPYRDRRKNLLILLHNLLPFMVRQQQDFRVFLVEQSEDYPFNRCLLFNVGYVESQRLGNFSCFIIHDTDLVPRDYRNLYRCDVKPRHFVIDRSKKPFHGLNYPSYIGGVLGVRRSHMEAINGCSNMYYGWGFEDDDLYIRFQTKDLVPERYRRQHLAEYTSLDHGMQPRNRHKHELLGTVFERMKTDGLNSLKYWVEDFQLRELYTWFLVRTPPPPTLYNDTQEKHKQVHKKH